MGVDIFNKYGKEYKRGDILFAEFEPGNTFYLIQEGKVKVSKIINNKEKTLDVFGPGDIFGEMAIIEKKPRSATVEAITDLKVLEFNNENFAYLLKANPLWCEKLIKSFSKRIYEAKRRVKLLLLKDPETRVMDTFCMLTELKNISKNCYEPISFTETPESIAHWAALEEDICIRILREFEKSNKITIKKDEIVVRNINEFYRLVDNKLKTMKKTGET